MRDSVDEHLDLLRAELPDIDPIKEQIVARINKIYRSVSISRAETLDSNELAIWQFKTLLMLRRQGEPYELSPSALADALGLTRGALSARLSGLEARGLIVREHALDDRRRVRVRLTDAGHRALAAQLDGEEVREQRILARLTDREKRILAALLRELVLAIEDPD